MVKAIILPIGKKVVDKSIKTLQKKLRRANANKEYYRKNRAKIDKLKSDWNKRNPEALKRKKKKYYDKNRSEILKKIKSIIRK